MRTTVAVKLTAVLLITSGSLVFLTKAQAALPLGTYQGALTLFRQGKPEGRPFSECLRFTPLSAVKIGLWGSFQFSGGNLSKNLGFWTPTYLADRRWSAQAVSALAFQGPNPSTSALSADGTVFLKSNKGDLVPFPWTFKGRKVSKCSLRSLKHTQPSLLPGFSWTDITPLPPLL